MEVFFATLKSVAILMGIGVVGFWILARKTVPLSVLGVLSPLVIEVALPCMIFYNIITRFDPVALPDWWTLPLWWAGMVCFFIVLTLTAMQFVDRQFKGEVGISLLFPNAVFFPLGIIPIIYGADSPLILQLFIFTIFMPALVFNGYIFFFPGSGSKKFSLDFSKILNPVLVATVLALFLKLMKLDPFVPDFMISITRIIGATALPLLMLTIGGNVYVDFTRRGTVNYFSSFKFIVAKNIFFPVATMGFLLVIRPPQAVAILMILQSAVPPLSAVPVFTERANGNVALTNQFLISSFIFSIITVPICFSAFAYVYL